MLYENRRRLYLVAREPLRLRIEIEGLRLVVAIGEVIRTSVIVVPPDVFVGTLIGAVPQSMMDIFFARLDSRVTY